MIQVRKDFKILRIREEAENLADECIKQGIFPKDTEIVCFTSVATVN